MMPVMSLFGKRSTCSEECFSLARLTLIRQSRVLLGETFVQLGKNFQGGATTLLYFTNVVFLDPNISQIRNQIKGRYICGRNVMI